MRYNGDAMLCPNSRDLAAFSIWTAYAFMLAAVVGCNNEKKRPPAASQKQTPSPVARAAPSTIEVRVTYPGASPEEVESGVVMAIEEALRSLRGVSAIRSVAREGEAIVAVTPDSSVAQDALLGQIAAAVQRIETFPEDIERPTVWRMDGAERQNGVSLVAITGDLTHQQLADIAADLQTALAATDEILRAEPISVPRPEIELSISGDALGTYGLSLQDIAAAVQNEQIAIAGGATQNSKDRFLVRTAAEHGFDPSSLGTIVIRRSSAGQPVFLRDIAEIRQQLAEPETTRLDGRLAIVLAVTAAPGTGPERMAERVRAATAGSLPPGVKAEYLGRFSVTDYRPGPLAALSLPQLQGAVAIRAYMPPGTDRGALEELRDRIHQAVRRVAGTDEVRALSALGTSALPVPGLTLANPDALEVIVIVPENGVAAGFASGLRAELNSIPGAEVTIHGPHTRPLVVHLRHRDADALARAGAALTGTVRSMADVSAVAVDGLSRQQVSVEPTTQAQALGVTAADIAGTVRAAVHGIRLGQSSRGKSTPPIVLRLEQSVAMDRIGQVPVRTASGESLPLAAVARIAIAAAPVAIHRLDGRRSSFVTMAVPLDDHRAIADELRATVLPNLAQQHQNLVATLVEY